MIHDTFETVMVDKVRFAVRKAASERAIALLKDAHVSGFLDQQARMLVFELEATLAGRKQHTEVRRGSQLVPLDWWQAIKDRWAPAWWKRRWPVQFRIIDTGSVHHHITRVCPHLPTHGHGPHLAFILNRPEIECPSR